MIYSVWIAVDIILISEFWSKIHVYEKQLTVSDIDFTESISLKNQAPGVYILRVECDGRAMFNKIVKK